MSLLANHTLTGRMRIGNITYFGSASVPSDNGSNIVAPITLTPPANMVLGDLVIVFCTTRNDDTVFDMGVATGGQTWTALSTMLPIGTASSRVFWCRFNGTWTGNPSFGFSTAESTVHSAVMHVFRPTVPQNSWTLEGESTPALDNTNPITIAGRTTTHLATLSIGFWMSDNAATFSGLTGTDWINLGNAQYRNTGGSDTSTSYAYKVQLEAGPTGSVAKTQSITGFGYQNILTFYEVAA